MNIIFFKTTKVTNKEMYLENQSTIEVLIEDQSTIDNITTKASVRSSVHCSQKLLHQNKPSFSLLYI